MDLSAFLLARIDEDEEDARDASARDVEWCVQESRAAEGWGTYEGDSVVLGAGKPLAVCDPQYGGGLVADHIARWDPARVLAECAAKRRIVAQWQDYDGDSLWGWNVLRALALPYADHADYRPEWAVDQVPV